jgi:hypothetical protein
MSFDDRLRRELRRTADTIEPDVGQALTIVQDRTRRRGTIGLGSLLGAAIAVVIVVVGLQAVASVRDSGPGASPPPLGATPDPFGYRRISGTYVVTLQASDGLPEIGDVAGEWTMALDRDGTMELTPPMTFGEGDAIQSGAAFSLAEDRLRTNLFQQRCDSVGAYDWSLVEDQLTLTPLDDSCALRATVLGERPWNRQ